MIGTRQRKLSRDRFSIKVFVSEKKIYRVLAPKINGVHIKLPHKSLRSYPTVKSDSVTVT